MNLTRTVNPREGTRQDKLLKFLSDGQQHSTFEIRERCGFTKGNLSSTIHMLRYQYGYIIDSVDHNEYVMYRLAGRHVPAEPLPYPSLGEQLRTVGIKLCPDGGIMVSLADQNGRTWSGCITEGG